MFRSLLFLLLLVGCSLLGCNSEPVEPTPPEPNPEEPNPEEPTPRPNPSADPLPERPIDPVVQPPTAGSPQDLGGGPQQWTAALSNPELMDQAIAQLTADPAASLPALRDALASENPQLRQRAAFVLGQLGADARPAAEELKKLAEQDDSQVVRDTARFALDAIGD